MFELVNKYHPDKVADRIAGAIVDLANKKKEDAVVAVEVLIGHGICQIHARIALYAVAIYTQDIGREEHTHKV